jgi:hypothetical protein
MIDAEDIYAMPVEDQLAMAISSTIPKDLSDLAKHLATVALNRYRNTNPWAADYPMGEFTAHFLDKGFNRLETILVTYEVDGAERSMELA